jgi:hypothetical protein
MNGLKKLSLALRREEGSNDASGLTKPDGSEDQPHGLFILNSGLEDLASGKANLEVE